MNKESFRELINSANIKQWQVAEKMQIREDALSRKLRHELSPEDESKIKKAVSELTTEGDEQCQESN